MDAPAAIGTAGGGRAARAGNRPAVRAGIRPAVRAGNRPAVRAGIRPAVRAGSARPSAPGSARPSAPGSARPSAPGSARRSAPDFGQRPMLVFWETTRACQLACRHCRASATSQAMPGELNRAEGHDLIEQVAGFGRPYPILVLTGGDCLLRPDLFDLVGHAVSLGVPVGLSPSVTPLLTPGMIDRIARSGVRAVSISLDGANAATHDGVRGVDGHFDATVSAIRALVGAGLTVQVNTTVMRANALQLADIACHAAGSGAYIWEVFFLVHVGRGVAAGAVTPAEHEDVCHFLYDAAHYGLVVRTVEAPFFRRIVARRRAGDPPPDGALYRHLSGRLGASYSEPRPRARARTPPRPATARASCSSPTTARCTRPDFSPWTSGTSVTSRCARSTGTIRCCARSVPPNSPAAAAAASMPTSAADHVPAPTPQALIRSAKIQPARTGQHRAAADVDLTGVSQAPAAVPLSCGRRRPKTW